jgi:4-hydroxy-tetrahydrodipicolinate reductase
MMRIAIHGTGRMAAAIVSAAAGRHDVTIIGLDGPKEPEWETTVPWCPTLSGLNEKPDLLIDFTLPEGTRTAAAWCAENSVALVSGVTGLPSDVTEALESAAVHVPVLWSPNLSLGVNLLADLTARAAAVLDDQTPVTVEDIHHQWKKDAPSGTALMLGERIGRERSGDSAVEYRSVREGEVIGEHTVTFKLAGEEFDLVHRAHDRSIYASGALDAGSWLIQQPAGMYSAADWLSGMR